ncbi:MAG: hypothetical protein Q9P01_12470 [Anaerolineae bacterium]|nr:hypothetical protein [Anaerolineae bacterium]
MTPTFICRPEQVIQNWAEILDIFFFAADHHTVSFFEVPIRRGCTDINHIDTFFAQCAGKAHCIFIIAIVPPSANSNIVFGRWEFIVA